MKVSSNKDFRNQMNELGKKQEKLVESRQKEIEHLKSTFDNQKSTLRIDHSKNIDELQDIHGQEIQNTLTQKEKRLDHIKNELKQTEDFLKNEEKTIKTNHQDKVNGINTDLTEKLIGINERSEELLNNQQYNLEESVQKQDSIVKQTVAKKRYETAMKVNSVNYASDAKIKNLEGRQKKILRNLSNELSKEEEVLRREYENQLLEQQATQKSELERRNQIHSDQVTVTKEHSETLMNQEKTRFKDKYQRLVDEHEGVISRLKETFAKQINNFKLAHTKKLSSEEAKASDVFYNGRDISPLIGETPDAYTVSIKVPDHEKDLYNISGHKREIKLSFARRFSDDIRNDETHLSTKRTESLTKTFNVSEIVDANSIKKSYQNGILTFKMAKA